MSAAALALLAVQWQLLVRLPLLFRAPGAAPWPPASTRLHLALLSFGSPLYAATVAACLLALVLRADRAWAAAARGLGAAAWRPWARVSYALYLIAEPARLWALLAVVRLAGAGAVLRAIAAAPLPSFAVVAAGSLAAAAPCALLLHRWVERPCGAGSG